ncbi:MAG: RNA polymerase sigma factor [Blastocatellia bacterium]
MKALVRREADEQIPTSMVVSYSSSAGILPDKRQAGEEGEGIVEEWPLAESAVLSISELKDCLIQLIELKYRPRLYARALRVFRNHHTAEDFVQEVLMRAYLALAKYSQAQVTSLKVGAWLRTIERHTLLNALRKNARRGDVESLDTPLGENILLTRMAGRFDQPEEVVIRDEGVGELRELMHLLPSLYSAVVVLRCLDELSDRKVVEELFGCSYETMRVRVHRGLHLLRKLAAEQGVEIEDPEVWAKFLRKLESAYMDLHHTPWMLPELCRAQEPLRENFFILDSCLSHNSKQSIPLDEVVSRTIDQAQVCISATGEHWT